MQTNAPPSPSKLKEMQRQQMLPVTPPSQVYHTCCDPVVRRDEHLLSDELIQDQLP